MKVLHLIHAFNRGGLEKWLLSMLRTIPRDVCTMDVCCKGPEIGPWGSEAKRLGATIVHCPLRPSHVGFSRAFSRILQEGDYDLIHSHLDVYGALPLWLAQRAGFPVICTFHNTDFRIAHPWWLRLPILREIRRMYGYLSIRYSIRHADLFTGVSKGVVNALTAGWARPKEDSKVLYLGVEVPPLPTPGEKETLRRSLGLPSDAPLVLHVGRFIEQKNHEGLLAIFERVVQSCPQATLLLVGEGILRPSIEALAEQRGFSQHVRFLGFRNDVPELMSRSDIFLLPSHHEGLPITALEASAAGIPVVGTTVPGIAEGVEHGVTGLLHDVKDVDGIAASVVTLLQDRGLARALGTQGRERVEGFFSAEASARRLLDLYKGFVAN